MSNKDEDLDLDRTIKESEETLKQLEDMMKIHQEKMDVLFKKTLIYTILWCVVTAVLYYVWPDQWYFWVAAVSAILYSLTFIFVIVMRRKLNTSQDDE